MNSNPMRGLLSAFLLLVCLAIGHLIHHLLIPALFTVLCLFLLACRLTRWLRTHQAEALEAVATGLPFALILLIVLQLKP